MKQITFSTKQEIFNSIIVRPEEIRMNENGCFNESLWEDVLLDKFIEPKDELNICELGTWLGYGANRLATYLKRKEKKFQITCVDTWLGSPEHLTNPQTIKEMKLKNGYPSFYYDFLEVTKFFENEDVINPFPNTTSTFFRCVHINKIKFDIVIIDASHQYEDVLEDLYGSWEMLVPGGVIIGDDLLWEPVSRAVKTFIKQRNVNNLNKTDSQYIIKKT